MVTGDCGAGFQLPAVGVVVLLARRSTGDEPVDDVQLVASRRTATSRATAAV